MSQSLEERLLTLPLHPSMTNVVTEWPTSVVLSFLPVKATWSSRFQFSVLLVRMTLACAPTDLKSDRSIEISTGLPFVLHTTTTLRPPFGS